MRRTRSLKKNRDFRQVYGCGTSVANRFLVLYAWPRGQAEDNRLGISVSKKVGNAVTRNRIKRLIRESYRKWEDRIAQGFDLVVVARVSAGALEKTKAFQEIAHSLGKLLKKQKLWQGEAAP